MDSEASLAIENNAILGKRKRSSEDLTVSIDLVSGHSVTLPHQDGSFTGVLDSKRPRLPPSARDLDNGVKDRSKPAATIELLPVEILQHVLSFLDPTSLARLMRVKTKFKVLLDSNAALPLPSGRCEILPVVPQESIWTQSRTLFLPKSPEPLSLVNELQMLRLVHNTRCQYCHRRPGKRSSLIATSPWNAGPGLEGVRTIWPLRIKSCSDCLKARLIKEQDLILSQWSALQPGLPFACFTPSYNYVGSATLQQTSIPYQLQITKHFPLSEIKELEDEGQKIRRIASKAYVRWRKGLEAHLRDFMTDVSRIEKWEITQRTSVPADTIVLGSSTSSSYSFTSGLRGSSLTPSAHTQTSHSTWPVRNNMYKPTTDRGNFQNTPFIKTDALQHSGRNLKTSETQDLTTIVYSSSHGNERTSETATKLKADRRTEIENRCLQLTPPLTSSELMDMEAFHAAIKIARPFNEDDWNVLKSRLLTEREQLRIKQNPAKQVASSSATSRYTLVEEQQDEVQHTIDTILARASRSTQEKVAEIATDFIKRCFMDGTNLTSESAPRFASDVLTYVGQRFYEIQEQEDAALSLEGHAPIEKSSSGMRTRLLELRHMKYVFDECIKPYTDLIQKELFMCSGCELTDKNFDFHGLIQHYAAKHTNTLSRGSRVVNWMAPWPKISPFRTWPRQNVPTTAVLGNPFSINYGTNAEMRPTAQVETIDPNNLSPPETEKPELPQNSAMSIGDSRHTGIKKSANTTIDERGNMLNDLTRPRFVQNPNSRTPITTVDATDLDQSEADETNSVSNLVEDFFDKILATEAASPAQFVEMDPVRRAERMDLLSPVGTDRRSNMSHRRAMPRHNWEKFEYEARTPQQGYMNVTPTSPSYDPITESMSQPSIRSQQSLIRPLYYRTYEESLPNHQIDIRPHSSRHSKHYEIYDQPSSTQPRRYITLSEGDERYNYIHESRYDQASVGYHYVHSTNIVPQSPRILYEPTYNIIEDYPQRRSVEEVPNRPTVYEQRDQPNSSTNCDHPSFQERR